MIPVYCITHDRAMTPHSGERFTCPDCAIERDLSKQVETQARKLIDHVAHVLDLMGEDTVPLRKDMSAALIEMGGAALRLQSTLK